MPLSFAAVTAAAATTRTPCAQAGGHTLALLWGMMGHGDCLKI